MDFGTIGGIIAALTFCAVGVIMAKGNFLLFVDLASVFVTVFGSISALFASHPFESMMKSKLLFKFAFTKANFNPNELIITLVSFSEKARREGLLALEDDIEDLSDDFLKKGIQLVVDGSDPEMVRRIMETEVAQMVERHNGMRKIFEDWAGLLPAFGMIGTLLGLVLMLSNLEDKAAIGPGMSAALITTLYGALIAYSVAVPIASKLGIRSADEVLLRMIMIEGVLSIQSGDNPRLVKDKLIAFLAPADREAIKSEVGD